MHQREEYLSLQAFAAETGGKFIEGIAWHSDRVEIQHNNNLVIFDHHDLWTGNSRTPMTRVISRIKLSVDFRFEIYNKDIFRSIEKLFGGQDMLIGDDEFDMIFILRTNDEFRMTNFMSNKKMRQLIMSQKEVNIQLSDLKGIWEGKLPESELELSYYASGNIDDKFTLLNLLELFRSMLDQLSKMRIVK